MQARLLEDCAHNLRIVYQVPVSESFLEEAGACRVTVNRFSQFAAGAEDHIVASSHRRIVASSHRRIVTSSQRSTSNRLCVVRPCWVRASSS